MNFNPAHLFLAAAMGLAATAMPEALAADELARDAAGWTIFRPSADTRLLYVSAAAGDDAAAGPHTALDPEVGADPFLPSGKIKPFRSLEAAMAQAREGMPDWVLLRRGESWDGVIPTPPSGRGRSEPFLLAAYGPGSERPVIRSGLRKALVFRQSGCRDIAVVDLDFHSHERDPAAPGYEKVSGVGGLQLFLKGPYAAERILIEGCRVRWASYGITLEAAEGATIRDVTVRRNVIVDSHGVEKAQGLWSSQAQFVLEENVFDHNGWSRQAEPGQSRGRDGRASLLNHNAYICDTKGAVLRSNLFLRASSIQNKFTANGGASSAGPIRAENNLYVGGEIGLSIGGNTPGPLRFRDVAVIGNVMLDLGRGRPTNRHLAWGLQIQDWDGGLVAENLFAHQSAEEIVSAYAIGFSGRPGDARTRNVTVRDNVIYRLPGKLPALFLCGGIGFENVRIEGNRIQMSGLATRLAVVPRDLAGVTFSGNRYWSGSAPEEWFGWLPADDTDLAAWVNASAAGQAGHIPLETLGLRDWATRVGERDAAAEEIAFPDPGRTIERYMAHLGLEPTLDAFIAGARQQSKSNWRPEFTADAVNRWVRAGFGWPEPAARAR